MVTFSVMLAAAAAAVVTGLASHAPFPPEDRARLKWEAKDMFYHAYYAYMFNAYPADELMPLSCQGRVRGVHPDRGDIDDALGNFSLTLIDSLDSLVVMDDLDEFDRAVRLVAENVRFDRDVAVSVFETNIRVVGGLISAHVLAETMTARGRMPWYTGQLLDLALDIGYRLLPAFNSTTGLPHPRVNLRHGIKPGKVKNVGETCTACAGTMILEFAALSRLSGEPIFEQKASRAMDVLWASRHRMSNLLGNVLNIHSGDWVRKDSGVGAGIDSYYEYVAKAYVLLGEDKYLDRWNTHYSAIMKYLSRQDHLLQDVHMHRPHASSRHFVDALGAFWPGLQVLMGDVKPAIESHEVLYQIMKRHHFIPEAFTTDFHVHWGQYLLRPEFVESTYFLHRATGDPHYLRVGEQILKSLQKHARVTCGYATIKDVRTLQLEDRMDSFVLSETFKYLYLLFADESDLPIDVSKFVFTTEGHLLPLTLARLSNRTAVPLDQKQMREEIHDEDVEGSRSCPSTNYLFPDTLRRPLANIVEDKCPTTKVVKRKLLATEFQSSNPKHLSLIKDMGISMVALADGRAQLLHTAANAKTMVDAEEGVLFLQEMIELSKSMPSGEVTNPPKMVTFMNSKGDLVEIVAGAAQFGRDLKGDTVVTGELVPSDPLTGCQAASNANKFWGKIVLLERGECMFVEKARMIEKHGAKGGIVVDNTPGTSWRGTNLFAMSGDGTDDISIPMVFLFSKDAVSLMEALKENPDLYISLKEGSEKLEDLAEIQQGQNEEVEEATPTPFDFTTPVASFIERSRKQVEEYFSPPKEEEKVEERENPETVDKDDVIDFSKLETLLNPNSPKIKALIEKHVLKNPQLLSELLSVKFPILLKVFRHFMRVYDLSPQDSYVRMFKVLGAEGADGIIDIASKLPDEDPTAKEERAKVKRVAASPDLFDATDKPKDEL